MSRARVSDEELAQWAEQRADDAGHLARELILHRQAHTPPPSPHLPGATDAYMRLITLFDQDATAASFLSEDGDGGFVGGVYRMAREIERLRAPAPEKHLASAFKAGFELSDKVAWPGGWEEAYSKWNGNSPAPEKLLRVYPQDLTDDLRDILSMMMWSTGPIAHALRDGGQDIKRKAEEEQAEVMHWLIGLALEHGILWRQKASDRIREIRDALATTEGSDNG